MMELIGHTGGTLNTAREQNSGCGTQTAGLAIGGMTFQSLDHTVKNIMATWTSSEQL
jgi:hypothetical protein